MLYLFTDKNQIKLLFQKKTMLGQYESAFYKKAHQLNLTENGQIANMDFFASAKTTLGFAFTGNALHWREASGLCKQTQLFQLGVEIGQTQVNAYQNDRCGRCIVTVQERLLGRHLLRCARW